jgi:hypothetical protein
MSSIAITKLCWGNGNITNKLASSSVMVNLTYQLDWIEKCPGLVKHNSGYVCEGVSRQD